MPTVDSPPATSVRVEIVYQDGQIVVEKIERRWRSDRTIEYRVVPAHGVSVELTVPPVGTVE